MTKRQTGSTKSSIFPNIITLKDNLAYIDWKACKLCRKCELVCPTGAICDAGFPMSARDMKVLADSHRKS